MKRFFKIQLIYMSLGFCYIISCGPSKAELVARQLQREQDEQEQQKQMEEQDSISGRLIVPSDLSVTKFETTVAGRKFYCQLTTVRHDGCEYIVWLNEQGEQVMHKPNCDNYQNHNK